MVTRDASRRVYTRDLLVLTSLRSHALVSNILLQDVHCYGRYDSRSVDKSPMLGQEVDESLVQTCATKCFPQPTPS